MDIAELLSIISQTAAAAGLSRPFIVGGIPRDRVMLGRDSDINDVDVTTGNEDSAKLGAALAQRLPESNYKEFDDGHSALTFRGLRIDISSNYNAPGIDAELSRLGVTDITPMKREIYSRDFTINTLLEELDFSAIYDLTEKGEGDIEARLLRCPIDPEIAIGNDARRILRAIKLHVKHDFKIEDSLRASMLKHRMKIKDLPRQFVQKKMAEIVRIDNDAGINALIEFNLLSLVPLTQYVYDILIKRRQILKAL